MSMYKRIINQLRKNSPTIMGILNVTPDSFSDGGKFFNPRQAMRQAAQMVKDGATIIDIGGESSRPGAKPVSVAEEFRRVVPVITSLAKQKTLLSLDTYKPEVAAVALELGVDIVNDISGLRNPLMRHVVAKKKCPVILMHMQGTPGSMQKHPRYKNVVLDIISFFRKQIILAKRDGINQSQIILDPGIGFGKTVRHNLEILKHQKKIDQAFPNNLVLIGASRKSFIGKLTGAATNDRLPGTLAVHLLAVQHGADILRVHDVAEHMQALAIQKHII